MSVAEQIVQALANGSRLPPQTKRSIRTYPAIVDGQQRRIIGCNGCGDQFAVSSRTIRLARAQGRDLYCGLCRKPATIHVTSMHRTFWIERMTLEQIVELAETIWGPREAW